jgi:hypothetical protein
MTSDELDQLCRGFAPVIQEAIAERIDPLERRLVALEARLQTLELAAAVAAQTKALDERLKVLEELQTKALKPRSVA